MTDISKPKSRGPQGKLFELLWKAFPEHRSKQGAFGFEQLSVDLGVTRQSLYRSINQQTLSPRIADGLIALSNNNDFADLVGIEAPKLCREELMPFVWPVNEAIID